MKICLFMAIPLMAQESLDVRVIEMERKLGEQLAAEVRRQSKPVESPAVDAYVKRVGERLVVNLKERTSAFSFETIAGTLNSEPISLPGGYVLIPAQFFLAAKDGDEFAGMLAHSIGHVVLRHGAQKTKQGQGYTGGHVPLIFMGRWAGIHAETRQPAAPLPRGFMETLRGYELEADAFGLELAARAGFAAGAFRRYIERMQGPDSESSALPARGERLARMDEILRSLPAGSPSSNEEFRRVQEAVREATGLRGERQAPSLRR